MTRTSILEMEFLLRDHFSARKHAYISLLEDRLSVTEALAIKNKYQNKVHLVSARHDAIERSKLLQFTKAALFIDVSDCMVQMYTIIHFSINSACSICQREMVFRVSAIKPTLNHASYE